MTIHPATLRELREELGWSQSWLATRACYSRQAVADVEGGRHPARVARVVLWNVLAAEWQRRQALVAGVQSGVMS